MDLVRPFPRVKAVCSSFPRCLVSFRRSPAGLPIYDPTRNKGEIWNYNARLDPGSEALPCR